MGEEAECFRSAQEGECRGGGKRGRGEQGRGISRKVGGRGVRADEEML